MVGSQYPFPLFEDGDFDIPSVYMKDVEGDRLAKVLHRLLRSLAMAGSVSQKIARDRPAG